MLFDSDGRLFCYKLTKENWRWIFLRKIEDILNTWVLIVNEMNDFDYKIYAKRFVDLKKALLPMYRKTNYLN